MTSMTLKNVFDLEENPLRKGVIATILRDVRLMEYIPWTNVNQLTTTAVRWKSLPTVAFRRVGAGYTASVGLTEQVSESLYGYGGEIEYDRVLEKIGNTVQDPVVVQTQMMLKAMALTFNDYFINGDLGVNPDAFEGLKKRVAGLAARQTVNVGGSGAAATDPTASVAAARLFLQKFEEAHYKCNAGQVQSIFMNEGIYYGFGHVLRYAQVAGGNWMDITKDSFDREVLTYKGVPFIDVGMKTDLSTEIIPTNETAGDGGTDATSVYFCSYDPLEGLGGIQLSELEVYDPLDGGEDSTKPVKKLRLDWWLGLAMFGKYAITRLMNFESAPNWT